ncbi:type I restriction enzyme r protein [Agrobacterium tumefaciens CCNWGS0286]|uniref:type I restriction enzyme HsdR N-terminal domain-containing protein n=1 Tax=Agrobacterium tumefaciens TaxID=358 RepID=UPI0002334BEF|nr:type I restriction enzyme HsdR N-terminal domain-containing protein [Agrobacterium tumefaciens]EHH03370.1 type I restriction enzyme r protein [Agrobacterium tumefaciens CCNWGS0286]
MSIFAPHNIETMNEDDVSGELVRPLCRALGYSQGNPDANLRSQISLQYDKAFLGHKNGEKDPVLRGRPDFVCEVVSYARWVVEAKKPAIELSQDDSYQAHTYATHPEIAAEFYMLTNGREFRLYRVGNPDAPALTWQKDETDDMLPALRNFLGPEPMKKRANVKIDMGKPLGAGLGSSAEIVGGHVVYEKSVATIPLGTKMDGLTNAVTGRSVSRNDKGLIVALVDVKSAFVGLDELHKASGFYPLTFSTADEFLSDDIQKPTLMQNIINIVLPAGTTFPTTLLGPGGTLPINVEADCYTQALGFVDGNVFRGTYFVDYEYRLIAPPYITLPFRKFEMRTEGRFEINFK